MSEQPAQKDARHSSNCATDRLLRVASVNQRKLRCDGQSALAKAVIETDKRASVNAPRAAGMNQIRVIGLSASSLLQSSA